MIHIYKNILLFKNYIIENIINKIQILIINIYLNIEELINKTIYKSKNNLRKKQNFIISNKIIYYKSWYFFVNSSYNLEKINVKCINKNESIYISEICYVLIVEHGNIGHFFHDQFFQLYKLWRKKPRKIFAVIKTDNSAATYIGVNDQNIIDFIGSVFGNENILYGDISKNYIFSFLIIPPKGPNLRTTIGYKKICNEIRDRCYRSFNINKDNQRKKIIFHTRHGLERKKIIGIDANFIKKNDIDIVELHNLNMYEQIKVLSEAKILIYVVGAGVFNLLFMSNDSKVLEINPYKDNSWAIKFGMSNLCKFSKYVTNDIKESLKTIQGDWRLDADIQFNENLKSEILKIIDKKQDEKLNQKK
jgi:hypothetical protein